MNEDEQVAEPWKTKDGGYYCKARNSDTCPKGLCGTGKCPIDAVFIACDLAKGGKLEEAERQIKLVTESDPDYKCAWANLGALQCEKGEYEAARTSCLRALRLDPDYDLAKGFYRKANNRIESKPGHLELKLHRYLFDVALAVGDVTKELKREPYPMDADRAKCIGAQVAKEFNEDVCKPSGPVDASKEAEEVLLMCLSEGFKVALAHKIDWPKLKRDVVAFLLEQDPTSLQDSWRVSATLYCGEIFDARKNIMPLQGLRICRILRAYAFLALCELSEWQRSAIGGIFAPTGMLNAACQGAYNFGIVLGEAATPPWTVAS